MTEPLEPVGLVSFGLFLPEGRQTAAELAAQSGLAVEELTELGLVRRCLPGPKDQPVAMAARAASQALEMTDLVGPKEVDLLLFIGEEYKDYIAQTASIRIQEELGCHQAWAFDLVGQGVTSLVGLRVARDLMIGDRSIRTALLAGGTRNLDLVDPKNPATRFLLPSSASGGAIILRRGHAHNRLREVAFRVDFQMADQVYVPGGGTENPVTLENLGSDQMSFQVRDPALVADYLKTRYPQALMEVIQRVSGPTPPDYLALGHLAPAQREKVLSGLKLSPDRSPPLYLWGRHGPMDPLLSLDLGLSSGALEEGRRVVLAGGGIGFTFGAALVEWG